MSTDWKSDFLTACKMKQLHSSNVSSYHPSEDVLDLVQKILDEAYFLAKEGKNKIEYTVHPKQVNPSYKDVIRALKELGYEASYHEYSLNVGNDSELIGCYTIFW